jgi:ribonuclease PH
MKRFDGRQSHQIRPVSITYNISENSAGSVLICFGKTKVLCTVMLQSSVPKFLQKTGTGWLTAEYAMLPGATPIRVARESSSGKRNGRNIEIGRLIGRALRSIVDLSKIGERTIYIDCDVIQADGGTRTASITGAFLALQSAVGYWQEKELIKGKVLLDAVAAISVGMYQNKILVDLNCREDNAAEADFNFIATRSGKLIEMQGGVEAAPIDWALFESMRQQALLGIQQLFNMIDEQHSAQFSSKKELLQGIFNRRSH